MKLRVAKTTPGQMFVTQSGRSIFAELGGVEVIISGTDTQASRNIFFAPNFLIGILNRAYQELRKHGFDASLNFSDQHASCYIMTNATTELIELLFEKL